MSNIKISDERIHKLEQIKSRELKEVCEYLRQNKKAAYEEENIKNLIDYYNKLKYNGRKQ